MRLIDADALSKDLEKRWNVNDDQDFCNKEVWHALEEAPTIEPDGDLISREDAVALVIKAIHGTDNKEIQEYLFDGLRKQMWSLPSAESTGAMDEAIQEYIKDGYMQPIGEDLISRQRAVKEIDSFCSEVWTESEADFARGLGTALSIVESLPSAEPKTGKWEPNLIDLGFGKPVVDSYSCSECKEESNLNYDYCPNCGARMHKGGEDK